MERLKTLNKLVLEGKLLAAVGAADDLEAKLESRFGDAFESQWLERWEKASKLVLSDGDHQILNQLREAAFKGALVCLGKRGNRKVLATQNSEVAALVSDDFELFIRCELGGIKKDSWVLGLMDAYIEGGFPC
jgi:hypothetical protein